MASNQVQADSWIQKTVSVCGGDACIRNTRHAVAGLVEWRNQGLSDERILKHHPDLTLTDLETAWSYYHQHKDEIDDAIRANAEN